MLFPQFLLLSYLISFRSHTFYSIFFLCLSCSLLSLVGACRSTECAHYAQCVIQRDDTALCVCPKLCSSSFRPVCGSNSRTYWNACFLRREACFMGQNTSVMSENACSKLHIVSGLHAFLSIDVGCLL